MILYQLEKVNDLTAAPAAAGANPTWKGSGLVAALSEKSMAQKPGIKIVKFGLCYNASSYFEWYIVGSLSVSMLILGLVPKQA